MTRLFNRVAQCGSSLVTTLLVIVILTIIATAFLQSMTSERQSSRSYLNRYQADLATQTALNRAENLLRNLFQKYPDSCTAWAIFPNTRGTMFYYRTLKGSEDAALPKDYQIDIRAIPLISGAISQIAAQLAEEKNVFPSDGLTEKNSVDLNRKGWIGGPPGQETQTVRAKWVDILDNPEQVRDDSIDASTGRPKNGPVARYAFWVEDESFRVNLNVAGADIRGDATHSGGSRPSEITIQGATESAKSADIARDLVAMRDQLNDKKILTPSELVYATGASEEYDKLKFFTTTTSSALNLSRGGVKRLNLNKVISDTTDAAEIHQQLARIIAAIRNPYAMPDISGKSPSPLSDFGQRFYRTGTGKESLNNFDVGMVDGDTNAADVYLEKIAVNIRDYIDTDSQPTIVENDVDFPVREKKIPDAMSPIGFDPGGTGSATAASDTVAVGKEAVPALQEYALRVKLITFTVGSASAHYKFKLDHYFEFLNPTNKDIALSDLGPNPFLLVSNQFGYDTGTGEPSITSGRPMQVYLNDFEDGAGNALKFPAGGVTVLTTDSSPSSALAHSSDGTHGDVSKFFRPKNEIITNRIYEGETNLKSGGKYRILAKLGTKELGRGGGNGNDYDTHMLIGNGYGVIESFTALPVSSDLSINNDDDAIDNPDKLFFRGGYLKGNQNSSFEVGKNGQTGDPRSLNEQLSILRYVSGSPPDSTRFFGSGGLDSNPATGNSSFGFFNGTRVDPTLLNYEWPDYTPSTITSASTAPARIANGIMGSIGQLGDIYDPVRTAGPNGITLARGGGRTLRVGQSDAYKAGIPGSFGLWDGKQDSISRNRAAWRLADIFSTNSDIETAGLLNINGPSRDNGAALRAALYKMKFSPGQVEAPKDVDIDTIVQAAQERFPSSTTNDPSGDKPFWERGEISELQLESDGLFAESSKLGDMKKTLDRGREEIIRRIIELITTKGNVYRAYCIGQSVSVTRNQTLVVQSQQHLEVIFALKPVAKSTPFDSILPEDDQFDSISEIKKRFRQPDDYKFEVLSVNIL